MAIDREQLLHVARLARLELREDEVERLEAQLNDDPRAPSRRSRSSTSATCRRPRTRSTSSTSGRDDEPRPCLPVEEALANAPEREGDFFEVPPGGPT